ncbi:hypothetical protein M446_4559 [Methylobacterium sp. 4-46]|uniref:hypothetical protein n=1 Tax=unclassified Methylobacterium TaxID=2615210 RepID=UPI000165CE1B|nr:MULTISPECIES: hypothetical protein [Methylobacterium]ACA18900.1 hypothetical protein M446_4559 [Methylobacterium sp. 4-46]WFT78123.1 hypothetical protein QA634_22875 [Methylobacterium nodulans]
MQDRHQPSPGETDLERSVAEALRVIAQVQAERGDAPVRSARLRLATIYGVNRLRRRLRSGASAAA